MQWLLSQQSNKRWIWRVSDRYATATISVEQQKMDMESDPYLIFYLGYTGSKSSLDHTNTTFKTFCLFPEIKETHNLQTKNQQLHTTSHQPSFAEPCYDNFRENTQEAEDNDSNLDVSVVSTTGVGLVKKKVSQVINILGHKEQG
jgi:hypothetical protein